MVRLLQGTDPIMKDHLANWYPEDYVRLGSPFSTLLEIIRGFLIYITRTYVQMKPYLKGLHMTIDSWRLDRYKEYYKRSAKEMAASKRVREVKEGVEHSQ